MWWNGRKQRHEQDPEIRVFKAEIAALTSRLDSVEKQMRGLDVEWSDTYDKMRKLMLRLSKRDQRDRAEQLEMAEGQPPPTNPLALRILQGSPMLRRGDE